LAIAAVPSGEEAPRLKSDWSGSSPSWSREPLAVPKLSGIAPSRRTASDVRTGIACDNGQQRVVLVPTVVGLAHPVHRGKDRLAASQGGARRLHDLAHALDPQHQWELHRVAGAAGPRDQFGPVEA
jgi:hypothetical protein